MAKEVVIKSNKYGMELILDANLPFSELLEIIGEKFRESGNFFKDAKLAVSFTGRTLTGEEQQRIVEKIMENSSVRITAIAEQGSPEEAGMRELADGREGQASAGKKRSPRGQGYQEAFEGMQYDPQAGFYKGNLRSGQLLECPTSVTLIGDVNPGAKIVSAGNVVILGALKGNACAGATGDNGCFIFALDMQPIQLQIGEYIAKSPDKEKTAKHLFRKEKAAAGTYSPRVAVARGGTIYIEPMTKGCLDNL